MQSRRDQKPVDDRSGRTERQRVVHEVLNFDAAFDRVELMLMMPESVRADALLVDEAVQRLDRRDLGHPRNRNTEKRANPIGHYLSRIDSLCQRGRDLESKPGRCEERQVARIGEEPPGILDRRVEPLEAVQPVDAHWWASLNMSISSSSKQNNTIHKLYNTEEDKYSRELMAHTTPANVTCNIDARGRRIRQVTGYLALTAALPLALAAVVLGNWPMGVAATVLAAGGGLGLFEARRGWCMVRAAGISTPF